LRRCVHRRHSHHGMPTPRQITGKRRRRRLNRLDCRCHVLGLCHISRYEVPEQGVLWVWTLRLRLSQQGCRLYHLRSLLHTEVRRRLSWLWLHHLSGIWVHDLHPRLEIVGVLYAMHLSVHLALMHVLLLQGLNVDLRLHSSHAHHLWLVHPGLWLVHPGLWLSYSLNLVGGNKAGEWIFVHQLTPLRHHSCWGGYSIFFQGQHRRRWIG
jgi:hypothetical protein